jgi:hypothetical protein
MKFHTRFAIWSINTQHPIAVLSDLKTLGILNHWKLKLQRIIVQ